jgi:hypothetical protein
MKTTVTKNCAILVWLLFAISIRTTFAAESFTEAFTSGKPYLDLRLRFASIDQDNALSDADALTLRTKLGYKTADYAGLSATIEVEDSRAVLGIDDYSVPPTGFKTGEFSVVADPETTEVDQAFVQYEVGGLTTKLGRQVLTLDNHRFVGHVGWRQDRQTFDGINFVYQANKKLSINASLLSKRNRIFAEDADLDSSDTLLNVSYQTSYGKLTAYAYLLEIDGVGSNSNDTYGVRFSGSRKAGENKFLYTAEFASQENNNVTDTDYFAIEGGVEFSGFTTNIGMESLGSDNGNGGFATPLATLHKFNGFADQFLATPDQGLEDIYLSVSGRLAGGQWNAIYHDFTADLSKAGADDLGDEINLVYTRKFGDVYSGGVKYADYSAGDTVFSKVDTTKFWIWGGASF